MGIAERDYFQLAGHPEGKWRMRVWMAFDTRDRLLLAVVCGLSVAITYVVSKLIGWPLTPSFSGSLLAGPGAAQGVIAVAVSVLLCLVAATLLVGRLRYEIGLFAAAIGLATLAIRGGSAGAMLRSMQRPQAYQVFIYEAIMLFGLMAIAWQVLGGLRKAGWQLPEPADAQADPRTRARHQGYAIAVQVIVSGLLVLLLAQNGNKKQVMAAVAMGSLIGAITAHQTFPVRPSIAFWSSPFIVAIIGYVWAIARPGLWQIGIPANPLASALPLDYASLGVAGSILGYWTSRQWRHGEGEDEG